MRDEKEGFDLSGAITPKAFVERLAKQGIIISERTLREKARQLGACRVIGKAIFLMPIDVETIVEAARVNPIGLHREQPSHPYLGKSYDMEQLLERLEKKPSTARKRGRPANS